MDLKDICRVFHSTTAKYTFFSAAYRTFSKIDHILDYKANLHKYKKIKIIPSMLPDYNTIKLEFNNKRNSKK
jgi:hypothetical protein